MGKVLLEIESDQIEDLIERLQIDSKVKKVRTIKPSIIDFSNYTIDEFKNIDPVEYQKSVRKDWDNEIFA